VQLGLGLVPIVPILLLPFILVFFIIVFPIWGVALAVLGLMLLIVRGLNAAATRMGVEIFNDPAMAMERSFRWVLTFGGFVRQKKPDEARNERRERP
jgi:hypothetical protein